MTNDAARADLNAAICGRLGAAAHRQMELRPGQPKETSPDGVRGALEAAQAALASGDAQAIVAADDALAAAVEANQPDPQRRGRRDWGQGARGTRITPPPSMNDHLRSASRPNLHPAHGSPGPGGRIR